MKTKLQKILIALLVLLACLALLSGCAKNKEYYTSIDQLNSKKVKIGVKDGSSLMSYTSTLVPDAQIVSSEEPEALAESLDQGKIDAFGYEKCYNPFMAQLGYSFTVLPNDSIPTHYGFIFADNERGQELQKQFNSFLASLKESGKLDELQSQWINSGEKQVLESRFNTWNISNGYINVATTGAEGLFTYMYEYELSGYETAILTEFCKIYHYGINYSLGNEKSNLENIASGKVDLMFQSIEKTPEKEQQFLFSDDTYAGEYVYYVLADPSQMGHYTSADQLNGKRAGSRLGAIDEQVIEDQHPLSTIFSFNSVNDEVIALKTNKIDYFLNNSYGAVELMREIDGLQVFSDESLYEQNYCLAFNKDSEEAAIICAEFNKFLADYKASGELDKSFNKWCLDPQNAEMPDFTFGDKPLSVGITATDVPYNFIRNGEYVGFEIELVSRFAAECGYNIEWVCGDFSALIPGVSSGKLDIAMEEISWTAERAESVLFSDCYLVDGFFVMTLAGQEKVKGLDAIRESFDKTFIREDRWKSILEGIVTTLNITISSAIIGTFFGFLIYLICRNREKVLGGFFGALARIMEGLPMVVVLMILYYIIFTTNNTSGVFVSIFGFSLSIALNVYSILKTSVSAIDRYQIEGAYSLGFTDLQTFFRIVLPQALQLFMPSYRSLIISLINGTAIVGYIAVQDLTKVSDLIRARTYEAFFPLISTAIIYFLLGAALTAIVKSLQFSLEPKRRSDEKILRQFRK